MRLILLLALFLVPSLPARAGDGDSEAARRAGREAYERGEYRRAAEFYRLALEAAPEDDSRRSAALGDLGYALRAAGEYAESETAFRRSLEVRERALGPDHADVGQALDRLAGAVQLRGRFAEAEAIYRRALAIRQRALGPDHVNVGGTLNNLALLYRTQARYAEAEPLYRRALELQERALGPDHLNVAIALNNLGTLYSQQGRRAEAERLYRRSLEIREAALDAGHPDVASSLNNLATVLESLRRHDEAEVLYRRSLAIRRKALGEGHPFVGQVLNNLGLLMKSQRRFEDAEALLREAVGIRERALGPDHMDVATSLGLLADVYRERSRAVEAEGLYRRVIAIRELTLGERHPGLAVSLSSFARALAEDGRWPEALSLLRRSTAILAARATAMDERARPGALSEQRQWSRRFAQHLAVLQRVDPARASEAFELAQLARASDTADQVARMAARHASGVDALAQAARERQDLIVAVQSLEARAVENLSRPGRRRDASEEARMRAALDEARGNLARVDARLATDFPQYAELASPRPLALEEAQALLAPHEALVAYLFSDEGSFSIVARRDRASLRRLEITPGALEKAVRHLRRQLDLGTAVRGSATAAADDRMPIVLPFDAGVAHELYRQLLAPLEPDLEGATTLVLVPDGALASLPPAVLVTSPPPKAVIGLGQGADVAWLAKRHATTVLPAVSSLRALRRFASSSPAREPFGGFGDPLLGGEDGIRGASTDALQVRGAVADVDAVRRLARLPESADELRAMAASLKAPASALRLGPQATERAVKEADLSRYRILAFATHGLMAGEFRGLGEPALVLTPPERGSELDDGLLTAGEISQLRLAADWVVLSACNTAAPDGTPGAEGLSGLAKAFFYAGARSLLVSHWSVSSEAAVALTTRLFEELARGAPRAEAHRLAMLALLQDRARPRHAHPAFWAPFVVVGEGSASEK